MPETRPDPSVAELFSGFFLVGVCGFGGVLPWARRMIVEQRQWLTPAEFTEMLGLCQFLPGGNIMNVTVALGSRFRGIAGAAAALVGLLAAPVAIVIALGAIYQQYADVPAVKRAFVALSAAACGYLLATAMKIVAPLRGRPVSIGIAIVTFVAVAVLRVPLLLALPVLALGSALLLAKVEA
ncbi:MAG: chromate transporter [Acetobacteraceae bacterium]|nr:chromate transporter [Pseudomonadota bacterium]